MRLTDQETERLERLRAYRAEMEMQGLEVGQFDEESTVEDLMETETDDPSPATLDITDGALVLLQSERVGVLERQKEMDEWLREQNSLMENATGEQ